MVAPSTCHLVVCREQNCDNGKANESTEGNIEQTVEDESSGIPDGAASSEGQNDSSIVVQMTAKSYVGQLKDKINTRIGEQLGLSDEQIIALPRMSLMTGRKVWSDVDTIRNLIQATGGIADLKYGTMRVSVTSADLRDPPLRSLEEEAELERVRVLHEIRTRQRARTKHNRPIMLRQTSQA